MHYMSKERIRKENIQRMSEDLKDNTTLVDVSGYIPNEVQYARMQSAGSKMVLDRMVKYNYDLDNMISDVGGIENLNLDTISELSLGHYADVKDVTNFVNNRMSNLVKKYSNWRAEVEALKKQKEQDDFNKNYLAELVNQWKQNPETFQQFKRTNNIDLD